MREERGRSEGGVGEGEVGEEWDKLKFLISSIILLFCVIQT